MKCECGGTYLRDGGDAIVCDRCSVDTTALSGVVGLCGCGNTRGLRDLVADALRAGEKQLTSEWIGESIEREFIIQALNGRDLLEHGSSAIHSWITENGRELLAHLEEVSADALRGDGEVR
jgi:hypothetical protein